MFAEVIGECLGGPGDAKGTREQEEKTTDEEGGHNAIDISINPDSTAIQP